MGLSHILITLLLCMAIGIGFTTFYGGLASNPAYGLTSENFTSFYAIQNMTDKVSNISTTFQNASAANPTGGLYVLTAPVQFIIGAAQAGLLVMDVPNIFMSMINDLTTGLGIPTWIMSVVEVIILITVTFAIIYFIISKR